MTVAVRWGGGISRFDTLADADADATTNRVEAGYSRDYATAATDDDNTGNSFTLTAT